jgi:hypothetical protein
MEAEEQAMREEQARREGEEQATMEAEEQAMREEQARREEEEQATMEAEEQAMREEQARREEEEQERTLRREERAKWAEQARREAEAQAMREAEAQAADEFEEPEPSEEWPDVFNEIAQCRAALRKSLQNAENALQDENSALEQEKQETLLEECVNKAKWILNELKGLYKKHGGGKTQILMEWPYMRYEVNRFWPGKIVQLEEALAELSRS